MKSNAEKVAELNIAFGNPKGDLSNPNVNAIRKQAKLCLEESVEAIEASNPDMMVQVHLQKRLTNADVGPVNMIQLADAIGDILTVAYGLAHVAGFDANKIYDLVHESNLTKFIRHEDEVEDALSYYWAMGFGDDELTIEGEFPRAYIKVAKTTVIDGKEYPEGKFLKNMVTFKEPDFSTLFPDYDPEQADKYQAVSKIINGMHLSI